MKHSTCLRDMILSLFLVYIITTVAVNSQICRFAYELKGSWTRSFDFSTVTFVENVVTGFKVMVNSQELSKFRCHNVYRDVYTIRANFVDKSGKTMSYYECWKFERLNSKVFLMYDLSEIRHFGREWMKDNRSVYDDRTVPPFNKICPRDALDEPYSVLFKKGTPAEDMGTPCPPTLVGHYAPEFECLESDLNFCNKDNNGMLVMEKCTGVADSLFETAGPLTCVGHKYKCPYVHASIFHLDRVDCFVFPEKVMKGVVKGVWYFGDCTMVGHSQVNYSIKLNLVNNCPANNPPIANKTRHCIRDAKICYNKQRSTSSAALHRIYLWGCLLGLTLSYILCSDCRSTGGYLR